MDKDINPIEVVLAEKKSTNKWLSEQLGCAPTTVSKWCTNACQPPMETYIRISKLLDGVKRAGKQTFLLDYLKADERGTKKTIS